MRDSKLNKNRRHKLPSLVVDVHDFDQARMDFCKSDGANVRLLANNQSQDALVLIEVECPRNEERIYKLCKRLIPFLEIKLLELAEELEKEKEDETKMKKKDSKINSDVFFFTKRQSALFVAAILTVAILGAFLR